MSNELAERLEAMAESDLIPMEAACDLMREAARAIREAADGAVNWISVSDRTPDRPGWYLGCNYGSVEPLRFDGSNWNHMRITRDLAMPSHWADFAFIGRPSPAAPTPDQERTP